MHVPTLMSANHWPSFDAVKAMSPAERAKLFPPLRVHREAMSFLRMIGEALGAGQISPTQAAEMRRSGLDTDAKGRIVLRSTSAPIPKPAPTPTPTPATHGLRPHQLAVLARRGIQPEDYVLFTKGTRR